MPERVGLRERLGAYFREHSATTARKLDLYLGEHMPDLIDKHKLATKTDFVEIDKRYDQFERDLIQLEDWRTTTKPRVGDLKKRMERLELKYGG